jgi:hypothetical protein
MPTPLPAATAEQVISAVEAVVAHGPDTSAAFVAAYSDMPADRAENALDLACELGLLTKAAALYSTHHPLSKLLRTPQVSEKAAVLRIVLEQFRPFVVFRQELDATSDASAAATRAKAVLDLQPHREDVRTTLLGLATFSGALSAAAGGKYERNVQGISASLSELAAGAQEKADAVLQVRNTITAEIANAVSTEHVIEPLADALRHASGGNAREAVVHAGNAIESFLTIAAPQHSVNLVGATGLNAKLDRYDQAGVLPKKIIFNGKYLGHVRNAADHGVDQEINQPWTIQQLTGLNYVYVALAFVIAVTKRFAGGAEI